MHQMMLLELITGLSARDNDSLVAGNVSKAEVRGMTKSAGLFYFEIKTVSMSDPW